MNNWLNSDFGLPDPILASDVNAYDTLLEIGLFMLGKWTIGRHSLVLITGSRER